MSAIPSPPLLGQKALVIGIANEHSIAYGCARAFRKLGAELALTYLNDKARPYVEPLARELEAPIFLPLDVQKAGQLETVFEQIGRTWGRLDIALHSLAFAPKEDLQGPLLNCSAAGYGVAMDISCHSFVRMARLAAPLVTNGGTLFAMTYYGSSRVVPTYSAMGPVKAALEACVRYLAYELGPKGNPRARYFTWPYQNACRGRAEGLRSAPQRGRAPRPRRRIGRYR
jgi:enoyl-[acyl-carrier protein] reductase I